MGGKPRVARPPRTVTPTFIIQTAKEIPPKRGSRGPKYPWESLKKPKQFFTVWAEEAAYGSVASAARAASKRYAPAVFTVRKREGGTDVFRAK